MVRRSSRPSISLSLVFSPDFLQCESQDEARHTRNVERHTAPEQAGRCEECGTKLKLSSLTDTAADNMWSATGSVVDDPSVRRGMEVCDGPPFFRHFCHLSCFVVRDVRDCHCSLSWWKHVICIAFCADSCLAQGQPVSLHSRDVTGVLGDEKVSSLRLSL